MSKDNIIQYFNLPRYSVRISRYLYYRCVFWDWCSEMRIIWDDGLLGGSETLATYWHTEDDLVYNLAKLDYSRGRGLGNQQDAYKKL